MIIFVDSNGEHHEISVSTPSDLTEIARISSELSAAKLALSQLSSGTYRKSDVDSKISAINDCISTISQSLTSLTRNVYNKNEVDAKIPNMDLYTPTSDLPNFEDFVDNSDFESVVRRMRLVESSIVNLGIRQYDGNANDITVTARYYVLGTSTNVPFTPCYLESMAANSNFIIQRATSSEGVEKKRVYNGSVWSAWK